MTEEYLYTFTEEQLVVLLNFIAKHPESCYDDLGLVYQDIFEYGSEIEKAILLQ